MKCPLKPVKILKDERGQLLSNVPHQETPAKVETDFGECDRYDCMAYTNGRCRMMPG